jgi:hypothetical protein
LEAIFLFSLGGWNMEPNQTDLRRIISKLGNENIVEALSNEISGSELNTLLLSVFKAKAAKISGTGLLKNYALNRFVHPAEVDPIALKQLELDVLNIAAKHDIKAIQLSPVAPLGCSSVIATVDQNKVISGLRGSEVVSDATNLMTLHIASLNKSKSILKDSKPIRFCTTHRHVRAQHFGNAPGMLPHFHLFSMVTAGEDKGSYDFEKQSFWEHITFYKDVFDKVFNAGIEITLSQRPGYKDSEGFLKRLLQFGESLDVEVKLREPDWGNHYYQGLQFTIKTTIQGKEHFIGDGGFVNWTQQLLGGKKERLLISAIGLDRLLL